MPAYLALARRTADRALAAGLLKPEAAERCSACWPTAREPERPEHGAPVIARIDAGPVLAHRRRPGARPRRLPGTVALVPTMGALHDGHRDADPAGRASDADGRSWSASSSTRCSSARGEDLDRYPRTLDADLRVCADGGRRRGVRARRRRDVPAAARRRSRVSAGPMGRSLEGASRPGHFDGVLTVVAKLFNLVRPDVGVLRRRRTPSSSR